MDSTTWGPLIRCLAGDFECLAFDARCSPSNRGGDASMDAMVRDLDAVIEAQRQPVVLVGHSLGGSVICRSRHPGVCALVLLDAVEAACRASLEGLAGTHDRVDVDAVLSWRPHWHAWFSGMTAAFLAHPAPAKALLCSSAAAMEADRALLIAQMQGKFQYKQIAHHTHFVHEDRPLLVSDAIRELLRRLRANKAG